MNLEKATQQTYFCKFKNRNTKKTEICSKLTIKTSERRQSRRSGVSIVNFEHFFKVSIVDFEHVFLKKNDA